MCPAACGPSSPEVPSRRAGPPYPLAAVRQRLIELPTVER
jgi:hypothetical protein